MLLLLYFGSRVSALAVEFLQLAYGLAEWSDTYGLMH